MAQRRLTTEEICDLAFRTTGQRNNSSWMSHRFGKLTSSHFGRAISAMNNPHSTNIQRLRDDLFAPKNLDHIPAIKWGVDHESVAIDAYQHITGHVVKPTGIWMFHNNIMGASPDGLVFTDPHGACAVGILEVKCPYSMRDVEIDCDSEWHHHLHYLDCNNELKKTHDYYHQIQGAMTAVVVDWCDFVIWTPRRVKIQRIPRDHGWSMRYVPQLEEFFKHRIVRKEDFDTMEWDSETVNASSDEDPVEPFEHPARDLTSILHPIGPAGQFLRHLVVQVLHVHISRWIYEMQSGSRGGYKWPKAVERFWNPALDKICETCVHKLFKDRVARKVSSEYLLEIGDIVRNIEKDDCLWSTLFFNPDFAAMVKSRVQTWEPTTELKQAPCTCHPFTRLTGLRYRQPTLHQSTLVMPPRSLTGLGPNYQRWLDAPNSEPFPMLKHDRQPPMLKYERQLAVDERYGITHYQFFIRANPSLRYKGENSFKIIFFSFQIIDNELGPLRTSSRKEL